MLGLQIDKIKIEISELRESINNLEHNFMLEYEANKKFTDSLVPYFENGHETINRVLENIKEIDKRVQKLEE